MKEIEDLKKEIKKRSDELNESVNAFADSYSQMTDVVREWNRDSEIQKLNEEIERLKERNKDLRRHSLFVLSDKELKAYKDFSEKHYRLHNKGKRKWAGNKYIFTISGHGIGNCISIKCPICDAEEDITDTSSW